MFEEKVREGLVDIGVASIGIVMGCGFIRGVKLTDDGLMKLVDSCRNLEELYLYAVPRYVYTLCIILRR